MPQTVKMEYPIFVHRVGRSLLENMNLQKYESRMKKLAAQAF